MLLVLWISVTPLFSHWSNWQEASASLPDVCQLGDQRDAVNLLGGTPSSRIVTLSNSTVQAKRDVM